MTDMFTMPEDNPKNATPIPNRVSADRTVLDKAEQSEEITEHPKSE